MLARVNRSKSERSSFLLFFFLNDVVISLCWDIRTHTHTHTHTTTVADACTASIRCKVLSLFCFSLREASPVCCRFINGLAWIVATFFFSLFVSWRFSSFFFLVCLMSMLKRTKKMSVVVIQQLRRSAKEGEGNKKKAPTLSVFFHFPCFFVFFFFFSSFLHSFHSFIFLCLSTQILLIHTHTQKKKKLHTRSYTHIQWAAPSPLQHPLQDDNKKVRSRHRAPPPPPRAVHPYFHPGPP